MRLCKCVIPRSSKSGYLPLLSPAWLWRPPPAPDSAVTPGQGYETAGCDPVPGGGRWVRGVILWILQVVTNLNWPQSHYNRSFIKNIIKRNLLHMQCYRHCENQCTLKFMFWCRTLHMDLSRLSSACLRASASVDSSCLANELDSRDFSSRRSYNGEDSNSITALYITSGSYRQMSAFGH